MNRFTDAWRQFSRRVVRHRTINHLQREMTLEQAQRLYSQQQSHREHTIGCVERGPGHCGDCYGNLLDESENYETYEAARRVVREQFPIAVEAAEQAFDEGMREKQQRRAEAGEQGAEDGDTELDAAETDQTDDTFAIIEDLDEFEPGWDEGGYGHDFEAGDAELDATAQRVLDQLPATTGATVSDGVLGKAQELHAAVMHAYTLENTPRGFIDGGTDEDEMGFDDYSELVTSTETALMTHLREHPDLEQHSDFQAWYMSEDDTAAIIEHLDASEPGWDDANHFIDHDEDEAAAVEDGDEDPDGADEYDEGAEGEEWDAAVERLERSMTLEDAARWFQSMQDSRIHDVSCNAALDECTACYGNEFFGKVAAIRQLEEAGRRVMRREDPAKVAFYDASYAYQRAEQAARYNHDPEQAELVAQLKTEMDHRMAIMKEKEQVERWLDGVPPLEEEARDYARLDWESGRLPRNEAAAELHADWAADPTAFDTRRLPYDGEDNGDWYRRQTLIHAHAAYSARKDSMTIEEARQIQDLARNYLSAHLDVQLAFANEITRQAETAPPVTDAGPTEDPATPAETRTATSTEEDESRPVSDAEAQYYSKLAGHAPERQQGQTVAHRTIPEMPVVTAATREGHNTDRVDGDSASMRFGFTAPSRGDGPGERSTTWGQRGHQPSAEDSAGAGFSASSPIADPPTIRKTPRQEIGDHTSHDLSQMSTQQLVDLASARIAQQQPTDRTGQGRAAQLANWHDENTAHERSGHYDAL